MEKSDLADETVLSCEADESMETEIKQPSDSNVDSSGWKPVIVNSVTHIGAIVLFYLCYSLDVPPLPFPVVGCLWGTGTSYDAYRMRVAFVVMWLAHFYRRIVEGPYIDINRKRVSSISSISTTLACWTFAVFISWSFKDNQYEMPPKALFIIGIVIFIVGEIGNGWCHWRLRQFRTRPTNDDMLMIVTGRVLPEGFLFNWVSCPHYLCEILTWTGFALSTSTLPSFLMLGYIIVILVVYARRNHCENLEYFDGEEERPVYPEGRKAIIPFVF